jgi:hypothetical protein
MKVQVTLTDSGDTVFTGEVELPTTHVRAVKKPEPRPQQSARRALAAQLDFEVNERAFMKAHARALSGPRKFVLLIAYLAKGQVGREVALSDIQKRWNRMTALLGGRFNRFFSATAKDNGWVNTKKKGMYILAPTWKEALTTENG